MSEAVSALGGASFNGYVKVEEIGPQGMITLRGDLASAKLKKAVKETLGVDVPAARRIEMAGERGAGWMSPDELLLILPYAEAGDAVAKLSAAMAGEHHMAVDVSDARAVFRVSGDKAREVIAKLSPVDLAPGVFGPGELRRTRTAQVAAAFWMDGEGSFTLVSFRSVGAYVMALLTASATPGGEVGLF